MCTAVHEIWKGTEKEMKQDLRITKTYRALTEAFFELLSQKKFEDITVNEICNRAVVRRATFYKHFGDKFEFFVFMVKEIQEAFMEKSSKEASNSREYYANIIRFLIEFLDENEQLVNSVRGSSYFSAMIDVLIEQIVEDVKSRLTEDRKNRASLSAPPEMLAQAFSGALVETVKWWVTGGKKIEKEIFIDYLIKLLLREV